MNSTLFVPDAAQLRHKLANPPPLLAKLYRRFQDRLGTDPEFRSHHIFLPALLGDTAAIAESKAIIIALASDPLRLAANQSPSATTTVQQNLDEHVWCIAPRAMRLAVYFTWLDAQGAWGAAEQSAVAGQILDFVYHYVVPVLRARTPAGHNQQLSMTLCCAVAGHALSGVPAVADRATALQAYALPKLKQTLGLMPRSGYSGEGSTYQTDVVSALVMWAGIFLEQLGESDVWSRPWTPNGATLADTLRIEAALGSCGGLVPPWDQYGWARLHNLAVRALWAVVSGQQQLLAAAEGAWDEESFIAWRRDDRLWTILYWPAEEHLDPAPVGSAQPAPRLTGWSVPAVGAATEQGPLRLRAMLAWDRCADGLQGICRGQANPNHLMLELGGEPITGDGWDDGRHLLFSESSNARTLQGFSELEKQLVTQQYGSLKKWVGHSQQGFVGASCGIVVDDWDSYFPRAGRRQGQLVFEQRTAERHTFAADAAAYYQPAFDLTGARRTVSVGAAGDVWIVDDLAAASAHRFTWRAWFRQAARGAGPFGLRLDLPSGVALTLAWTGETHAGGALEPLRLTPAPAFPATRPGLAWPETGSVRCDLVAGGHRVRFVTCLLPRAVDGLVIRGTGANAWEATWDGGASRFALPSELERLPEPAVFSPDGAEQEVLCDLDEEPFALRTEPDPVLLEAVTHPPQAAWRSTTAAMQTLTSRGNREALPRILALLEDPRQNYTVHSVAAWCLGRVRYRPALATLRRMAAIPEVNTAHRAAWAVEHCQA